MYGIYANIGGILMVNVTMYSIHGSYGKHMYLSMLEKAVLLPATKMRSILTVGCSSMFFAWSVAVRIADISFKIISKLDDLMSLYHNLCPIMLCQKVLLACITHRIHVCYIWQHVPSIYPKC